MSKVADKNVIFTSVQRAGFANRPSDYTLSSASRARTPQQNTVSDADRDAGPSLLQLENMSDCRAPAELSASSQRHPAVSKLLKAMHSPDASRRAHALDKLSEVIGAAYGEAGAEVGQAVRNGSGIALLARLLADPYPQVQQQALFVVGNLCSASVDAGSDETKKLLLQHGAGRSLISHAFSDDRYTLTLACGALQNLCGRGESDSDGHDREWSKLVVQVCPRLLACVFVRAALTSAIPSRLRSTACTKGWRVLCRTTTR